MTDRVSVTEQLFDKICWLLAPRAGGVEVVKRLAGPVDEAIWSRWIAAGLLTPEEAQRLDALGPDEARFSQLQQALSPPPADEEDWSVDISGDITLPDLAFSSVDLSWEHLDEALEAHERTLAHQRFERGALVEQTRLLTTYEARDTRLGREMHLHKHRAGGAMTCEEFILAVQRQANLQHAHIRVVYELGLDEHDAPFFVTSKLDGQDFGQILGDLFARREAASSTLSARVEILLDVARALLFAHHHGFIHRDLRPKHIKVGRFGEVYLDGWLRARSLESPPFEDLDKRLSSVLSGSGFLPPERLERGLSACDASSDLWSLGALLYASFGLTPPLSGPLQLHASGMGLELDGGAIPKRLLDLCRGALVSTPRQRRLSVHDFVSELEEYLEGRRAQERRGEQIEALLAEVERGARRFKHYEAEATEALYEASTVSWAGCPKEDAPEIKLDEAPRAARPPSSMASAAKQARRARDAFLEADMACIRALSMAPQHFNVRWQMSALHLHALRTPARPLIGVPEGYLRGTIDRYAPPQLAAQLSAPIRLELRVTPPVTVSLHALSDEHGVLVEGVGRPLNATPLTLTDLSPGPYTLRLHDARGRQTTLPIAPTPGAQLDLNVALPEGVPRGFVFIPAGPFLSGQGSGGPGVKPAQEVYLEGFFLAQAPLTFGDYQPFLAALSPEEAEIHAPKHHLGAPPLWPRGAEGYSLPFTSPCGEEITAARLLFGLSPADARAFLKWRSREDNQPYRLPSALEWEKAARAADGRVYPWGDRPEPAFCALEEGADGGLASVGVEDQSLYGVRALAGGVQEYAQGEAGVCLKGGAWGLPFSEARACLITPFDPRAPLSYTGLRLAIGFGASEDHAPITPRVVRWSIPELRPHHERDTQDRSALFENELSHELLINEAPAHSGAPPSKETLNDGADRYLLGDELARGSMGRVLLAFDTVLKRQVALKILHDRHQANALARYRFIMEARITGRLNHPLVIPIYDMGYLPDGAPFFAMKRVEGANLQELLKQRGENARVDHRLDWFISIMRRVCQGVAFANQNQVIHRDLKPANILIGAFGEVIIVDLGLARQLDPNEADRRDVPEAQELAREDGRVTQIGSIIGTPYYMSPEQALGQLDKVGPNSDVYGLGAILYHLVAQRPPFPGRKVNEVLEKVRKGDPKPPSELISGVDPELERVILQALSKEPSHRQGDALILAQELAAWQEHVRLRRLDQASAEEREAEISAAWRTLAAEIKRLEQLRRQIRQLHREVHQSAPVERRRLFWRASQEQSRAEVRVDEALSVALREGGALGLTPPRLEIFKYYYRQMEQRPDPSGLAWYRALLGRLQPEGALSAWFSQTAPALIQSQPPGLELSLKSAQTGATFYRTQSPLKIKNLQPGGYIASLRREGQVTRVPFTIQRERPVTLDVDCEAEILEGFIHVPKGPFLYGDAGLGIDQTPRWVVLAAFQIAASPVTVEAYQRFLRAISGVSPKSRVDRAPRLCLGGPPLWISPYDERFGPFRPQDPVTGVSLSDAMAYAEWRAAETGLPLRLPSSLEWEKAARGIDGQLWLEGEALAERGSALSPFGMEIRDRQLLEWTLSATPDDPRACYVRGGDGLARFHSDPLTRRLAWDPNRRDPRLGFRLVLQAPARERGRG